MGFCAGYNVPGYMNPGFNPRSRGEYGYGRGMGRGNRWGYYATGQPGWARRPGWDYGFPGRSSDFTEVNRQDEIQYLKNEARNLERTLKEINSRIDELSKMKETQG
jgi:hypothetical protein